jgi:ribosomal protein S27AE
MTQKQYQEKYAASGLCKNCGCRPPKRGCTWCVRCMRTKNLTQIDLRKERTEKGLCPKCGLCQPKKDRWACGKCLEITRKASARYRAKMREGARNGEGSRS